jgi:hypothetical protein
MADAQRPTPGAATRALVAMWTDSCSVGVEAGADRRIRNKAKRL